MKNFIKKFGFAAIAVLAAAGVAYAAPDTAAKGASNKALCDLILQLKDVFNILRILAFVGAAFVIASIGWDAITKKEYKWDTDGKKHLMAMIVGFTLLFGVGVILTFLTGDRAGCAGGNW